MTICRALILVAVLILVLVCLYLAQPYVHAQTDKTITLYDGPLMKCTEYPACNWWGRAEVVIQLSPNITREFRINNRTGKRIATCFISKEGDHVEGCRLEKGHMLSDVVNRLYFPNH